MSDPIVYLVSKDFATIAPPTGYTLDTNAFVKLDDAVYAAATTPGSIFVYSGANGSADMNIATSADITFSDQVYAEGELPGAAGAAHAASSVTLKNFTTSGIILTAGDNAVTFTVTNVINSGTFTLNGDTFTATGTVTNSGTFSIISSAVAATFAGTGNIQLAAGTYGSELQITGNENTITAPGSITLNETASVSGKALTLNGANLDGFASISAENVNLNGFLQIYGENTVNFTDTVTITGGVIGLRGGATLKNSTVKASITTGNNATTADDAATITGKTDITQINVDSGRFLNIKNAAAAAATNKVVMIGTINSTAGNIAIENVDLTVTTVNNRSGAIELSGSNKFNITTLSQGPKDSDSDPGTFRLLADSEIIDSTIGAAQLNRVYIGKAADDTVSFAGNNSFANTLVSNVGTINVKSGKLTAKSITGGSLTADVTGYEDESYQLVAADLENVTVAAKIGTYTAVTKAGSKEGLWLSKSAQTTFYVNSDYSADGAITDTGFIVGYNAFNDIAKISTVGKGTPPVYRDSTAVEFKKGKSTFALTDKTYYYADTTGTVVFKGSAADTILSATDYNFYLMGKTTGLTKDNYAEEIAKTTTAAQKFEIASNLTFVTDSLLYVGQALDTDDFDSDKNPTRQAGKADLTIYGKVQGNIYVAPYSKVTVNGSVESYNEDKKNKSLSFISAGSELAVVGSDKTKQKFQQSGIEFFDNGKFSIKDTTASLNNIRLGYKALSMFNSDPFVPATATVEMDNANLVIGAGNSGDTSQGEGSTTEVFVAEAAADKYVGLEMTLRNGSTLTADTKTFNVLNRMIVNVGAKTDDTGSNLLSAKSITNAGTIEASNGSLIDVTAPTGYSFQNSGTVTIDGSGVKSNWIQNTLAGAKFIAKNGATVEAAIDNGSGWSEVEILGSDFGTATVAQNITNSGKITIDSYNGKRSTVYAGTITNLGSTLSNAGEIYIKASDVTADKVVNQDTFELSNGAKLTVTGVDGFNNSGDLAIAKIKGSEFTATTVSSTADKFTVSGTATVKIGKKNEPVSPATEPSYDGGLTGTINVADDSTLSATTAIYAAAENATVVFDKAVLTTAKDKGILITEGADLSVAITNKNADLKVGTVADNGFTAGDLSAASITNIGKISADVLGASVSIVNNEGATILANNIEIKDGNLENAGTIGAADAVTSIDLDDGNLTNSNTIYAETIETSGTISNSGLIDATGSVTAGSIFGNSATFTFNGATNVTGADGIHLVYGSASFNGDVTAYTFLAEGVGTTVTFGAHTVTATNGRIQISSDAACTANGTILDNNQIFAYSNNFTIKGNASLKNVTGAGLLTFEGVNLTAASVSGCSVSVTTTNNTLNGTNSFGNLTVAEGAALTINAQAPTTAGACLTVTGDLTNDGTITIDADALAPLTTAAVQIISVTKDVNVAATDIILKNAKVAEDYKGYTAQVIVRTAGDDKGIYLCAVPGDVDTQTVFVNNNWTDDMTETFIYGGEDVVIGVNGFVSASSAILGNNTAELKVASTGKKYDGETTGTLVMKQNEKAEQIKLSVVSANSGDPAPSKSVDLHELSIVDSENAIVAGAFNLDKLSVVKSTVKFDGVDANAVATSLDNSSTLNLFDTTATNLGAITGNGKINTDWGSTLTFTGFAEGKLDVDMDGFTGTQRKVVNYAGDGDVNYGAMLGAKYDKYFLSSTTTGVGNDLVTNSLAHYVTNITSSDDLADIGYSWLGDVNKTTTYYSDEVVIKSGNYGSAVYFNNNRLVDMTKTETPQGEKDTYEVLDAPKNTSAISIDGGQFGASVFGGVKFLVTDRPTGEVVIGNDINMTINDGTFTYNVYGGDNIKQGGYYYREGDITLTVNGGTFEKQLVAGMLYNSTTQARTSVSVDSTNLIIQGGTFVGGVYGGNSSLKYQGSQNTSIIGDATVTIVAGTVDAKNVSRTIDLDKLTVGSYGYGAIDGNTHLILTGSATSENLEIGSIWGGCGGDYYTEGDKRSYVSESISKARILSFTGFTTSENDPLNCKAIYGFSDVTVTADKNGVLTNAELRSEVNLSDVSNWAFEAGNTLDGAFKNDFTGDKLTLDLTGIDTDFTSWNVFEGMSTGAVETFGKFATVTIGEITLTTDDFEGSWIAGDYELALNDSDMVLRKYQPQVAEV